MECKNFQREYLRLETMKHLVEFPGANILCTWLHYCSSYRQATAESAWLGYDCSLKILSNKKCQKVPAYSKNVIMTVQSLLFLIEMWSS